MLLAAATSSHVLNVPVLQMPHSGWIWASHSFLADAGEVILGLASLCMRHSSGQFVIRPVAEKSSSSRALTLLMAASAGLSRALLGPSTPKNSMVVGLDEGITLWGIDLATRYS